jgi:Protein of unknown function (DUF1360)
VLVRSSARLYDPGAEVDLGGFTGSLLTYASLVLSTALLARARGHRLPDRFEAADLVLGAVAVHKGSRLVAKSSVTSPLRAPFTRFEGASGSAEHQESAQEVRGWRHAVGELVTCPFCMDVWLATAFTGGLVLAPRHTRAAGAVLAVVSGADWLHQFYERLKD